MEPLHVTHLIIVSAWGGLVLAESILELAARDPAQHAAVARAHFWIDVLAELPLILAVLVTGVLMAARAWPLTPLHWLKVGAALVAVVANLYCAGAVVMRHRERGDPRRLAHWGKRVRLSALAIPFAVVAAFLGLSYFRG